MKTRSPLKRRCSANSTCHNRLNVRRDRLEAQVLAGLSEHLLKPDLFKLFADEFYAELNRLRTSEAAGLDSAKHELAQIERKLAKLINAITEGGPAKTLMAEVRRLEARQSEVKANVQAASNPVQPLIHPALPELYRQKVGNLKASLDDPTLRDEATELIRSLVEAIVLTPVDGKLAIELRGDLASILALCAAAKQQKAPANVFAEAIAKQVKVVAGVGFEPTTFRL